MSENPPNPIYDKDKHPFNYMLEQMTFIFKDAGKCSLYAFSLFVLKTLFSGKPTEEQLAVFVRCVENVHTAKTHYENGELDRSVERRKLNTRENVAALAECEKKTEWLVDIVTPEEHREICKIRLETVWIGRENEDLKRNLKYQFLLFQKKELEHIEEFGNKMTDHHLECLKMKMPIDMLALSLKIGSFQIRFSPLLEGFMT
ncbi:Protein CBG27811 [Caenorhabditis briggsae]|uniref:Protein CBG27811 n=1 Tax=Caenorhabditis briggsae TaxID=6238 RepID=B6IK93_CAEBR|nr:Protein CBG27811 [Caenorhabditis briggsae]CAS00323.1 Protein CBG27811 [Caenorhabditis briggsae]